MELPLELLLNAHNVAMELPLELLLNAHNVAMELPLELLLNAHNVARRKGKLSTDSGHPHRHFAWFIPVTSPKLNLLGAFRNTAKGDY
jgi:hypothetical protein